MPKATQVKRVEAPFSIPQEFKGGTCAYCNKEIRDYYGTRIGALYCDFNCYLKRREHEKAQGRTAPSGAS